MQKSTKYMFQVSKKTHKYIQKNGKTHGNNHKIKHKEH